MLKRDDLTEKTKVNIPLPTRIAGGVPAVLRAAANALLSLPNEGDSISFEGEALLVTKVTPFVDKAEERHEITVKRPQGAEVFHLSVDNNGNYTRLPS